MHDLIIIGSGPAGLSAAVYGRRAGFSTLVIEKNPMSGGQVLNTYEAVSYTHLDVYKRQVLWPFIIRPWFLKKTLTGLSVS